MPTSASLLNDFFAAAENNDTPQALSALRVLVRNHLDPYFIKDEFTDVVFKMFSREWLAPNKECVKHVFEEFGHLVLPDHFVKCLYNNLNTRSVENFWIYEAFAEKGFPYAGAKPFVFMAALQMGAWESVEKSLPYFLCPLDPKMFVLALRNPNPNVAHNIYALCEINDIEHYLNYLNSFNRFSSIDAKDVENARDFLSHQQRTLLQNHIDGTNPSDVSLRPRKI